MIQAFNMQDYPTFWQYADAVAKYALSKNGKVWYKNKCYYNLEALSLKISTALKPKITARLWSNGTIAKYYELQLYKDI